MPYELIFIIPFVVGVVWIMYRAIKYEEEMSGIIDQTRREFDVVEKDGFPYVVPNVDKQLHQD